MRGLDLGRHRGIKSWRAALFACTLATMALPADAQQQYYVYPPGSSRPSVIVDFGVLEKLGPAPTLPGMLRSGRAPVVPATQGGLLPPPAEPPRSELSLPGALATRAAAPQSMPRSTFQAPPQLPATAPPPVTRTAPPPARPAAKPVAAPKAPPPPPIVAAPKPPTAPQSARVAPKAPPPPPKPVVPKAPARVAPPPPKPAPQIPKATVPRPAAVPPPPVVARATPPKPVVPRAPAVPPKPAIPTVRKPSVPPPPKAAPAAAPTQVSSVPPPTSTTADGTIRVGFNEDSSDLPTTATGVLDQLVAKMSSDSGIRVQLHGYANGSSASPSQARRLSLFRALSVRTYLMKKGIRSTRIDVRALGKKEDGAAANRVDVVIQKS